VASARRHPRDRLRPGRSRPWAAGRTSGSPGRRSWWVRGPTRRRGCAGRRVAGASVGSAEPSGDMDAAIGQQRRGALLVSCAVEIRDRRPGGSRRRQVDLLDAARGCERIAGHDVDARSVVGRAEDGHNGGECGSSSQFQTWMRRRWPGRRRSPCRGHAARRAVRCDRPGSARGLWNEISRVQVLAIDDTVSERAWISASGEQGVLVSAAAEAVAPVLHGRDHLLLWSHRAAPRSARSSGRGCDRPSLRQVRRPRPGCRLRSWGP
jgi:hypothetical protein